MLSIWSRPKFCRLVKLNSDKTKNVSAGKRLRNNKKQFYAFDGRFASDKEEGKKVALRANTIFG